MLGTIAARTIPTCELLEVAFLVSSDGCEKQIRTRSNKSNHQVRSSSQPDLETNADSLGQMLKGAFLMDHKTNCADVQR